MPTYQYVCRECETTKTDVRSISSSEPTFICEKCGMKMNKIFNLSGITFNGSGFYSKDK